MRAGHDVVAAARRHRARVGTPGSFAASVTGDEVDARQTAPRALRDRRSALGVDPSACVAIEDSPTGVASALAAGCATIGVPHQVALSPAAGLTVLDSLRSLSLDDLRRLAN